MPVSRAIGVASPLLLILLWPGLSVAQERSQEQALRHEVSVTLKLVQVFVTDSRGKPIRDLEKADFEIYDNGVLKTITEFEKHFIPARLTTERPVSAPAEAAAAPPAPEAAKLGRKFFFVFDVERNDLQGLAQSKTAALRFLETNVLATDEIGVLSYQARRGLVVHEYLSRDRERVKRAIVRATGVPGSGTGGLPTEPDLDSESGLYSGLVPKSDPEKEYVEMLRRNFVRIMSEFAVALRDIPGYKNVVLFSAGFAQSALVGDSGLRRSYEEMGKAFGSSSSPIYAVNALGDRSHTLGLGSRGDASLKDLSALSGGRYYEDVAEADRVMGEINEATSNYYVLGYAIGEQWDGRYHEIRVRVQRPGCIVSSQSGYFSPKPFSEFTDLEKQLHLVDLVLNERPRYQEPIELPLAALPCRDESGAYLVVMTEIPAAEEIEAALNAPVEASCFIVDQENDTLETKAGLVRLPDRAKNRVFFYSIAPIRPGAYRAALILRNTDTGRAVRARGDVVVLPPSDAGLQVGPLLLLSLDAGKATSFFRLARGGQKEGGKAAKTLDEFFPFLTDRLPPVMDEAMGGGRLFGIVNAKVPNDPSVSIELSAVLEPRSGEREEVLPVAILKRTKGNQVEVLLLDFGAPNPRPGDYALSIIVKDRSSGTTAKVTRELRFK